MYIVFAIKRALKLNNSEASLIAKHAGFKRVVYNFGHGSNAGNTMRATFGEKATTSQGDLR